MTCWASQAGGCWGEQSGEHLFSRCLFEHRAVTLKGLPWCRHEYKTIGIESLTSNILCHGHNGELSPVDSGAKLVWDSFRNIDELHNLRKKLRPRVWSTKHWQVSGLLFERWFLKTTINLLCSVGKEGPWSLSGPPSSFPPVEFVAVAFGRASLLKPRGLYMSARIGDQHTTEDSVTWEVLEDPGGYPVGASFKFRGFPFLLWLHSVDPGKNPSPLENLSGYAGVQQIYHPLRVKIADSYQCLDFGW